MSPSRHSVLWIPGAGSRDDELLKRVTSLSLHSFVTGSPDAIEEMISGRDEGPPLAVVIDNGVENPLHVARKSFRLAPLAQIVFIADANRLTELRDQLRLAPMIGSNWTVVEPDPAVVAEALEQAAKSSRQRRHLKTSLDNINLHLGQRRPPGDSAEYRRLVVSDKYLLTILEHAQDAIISLDSQARIATWNRGAIDLFGYTVEQSARLELMDLIASESRDEVGDWFRQARGGEAVVQMEATCRRFDGVGFVAEMTFAPVRDDVGEVIAVSLVARDVTERHRAQAELQRMQGELERRVAQRTADLERVNRELEAFTYSASHDLRAPLRGIDGFSLALLEDYGDDLDERASGYIGRIRAGARRMGNIIDALLMLSRLSSVELRPSRVDIGQMAKDVVASLREEDPEREVELVIQPGLVTEADPELLRIALQNLLGNAWKFTAEREHAEIELGRVEDADIPTYFVRDNGAGFDMAYVDKLFLPFQRLHDPGRFEGTGIGLGTVQRVINRHGGRVWAKSAPNRGATFYFQIP